MGKLGTTQMTNCTKEGEYDMEKIAYKYDTL